MKKSSLTCLLEGGGYYRVTTRRFTDAHPPAVVGRRLSLTIRPTSVIVVEVSMKRAVVAQTIPEGTPAMNVGFLCLPKGVTSVLSHGMQVEVHGVDPVNPLRTRVSCAATKGQVVSVLNDYVSSTRPIVMRGVDNPNDALKS